LEELRPARPQYEVEWKEIEKGKLAECRFIHDAAFPAFAADPCRRCGRQHDRLWPADQRLGKARDRRPASRTALQRKAAAHRFGSFSCRQTRWCLSRGSPKDEYIATNEHRDVETLKQAGLQALAPNQP